MCKNLSPTKTRRGNCLILPHTGYALEHVTFFPFHSVFQVFILEYFSFCKTDKGVKLLKNWLICRLTAQSIAVYRNKTSVFEYVYAGGTEKLHFIYSTNPSILI